ncbi:MAG: VCBS repeat-containing protein [Gemmatimonadota bacterium]
MHIAAAALLVGCTTAGGTGASAPDAGGADVAWHREVAPFPVVGRDGAPLDLPFLGGLDAPRLRFADLDGDGDPDLLLQERTDELMFLENVGDPSAARFEWRTDRFEGLSIGEWFRPLDADGDGDVDLFVENPFNHLSYYRNDAGPGAAPRLVLASDSVRLDDGTPVFSDRQNIPSILDLDCNGLLDLFIGRIDGTVSRFEAVAPVGRTAPAFRLVEERWEDIQVVAQLVPSLHGANAMAFGDVDADGDTDLLWGDFFEPGLLLFENFGTCARPRLREEPAPFPAGAPVATSGYNAGEFVDLDGDGDSDLVIGVIGGAYDPSRTAVENVYLLERVDAGWDLATRRLLRAIDVGSESVPALGDLDGDGDVDILVGTKIEGDDARTASLRFLENVGTPTAPAFRERGRLGVRGGFQHAPALGDLDADGDADLLLGTWNRGVSRWRNDGPGADGLPTFTLLDSAYVRLTRGSHSTPALGDVDGDGDLDLAVGESSGEVNLYRNVGSAGTPSFELVTDNWGGLDVGRRSAPALVDLDGDGAPELALGGEAGGLTLVPLDGSAAGAPVDLGLPLPANSAPAFADLDGDGRPELIAGNRSGGLLYYSLSSPSAARD